MKIKEHIAYMFRVKKDEEEHEEFSVFPGTMFLMEFSALLVAIADTKLKEMNVASTDAMPYIHALSGGLDSLEYMKINFGIMQQTECFLEWLLEKDIADFEGDDGDDPKIWYSLDSLGNAWNEYAKILMGADNG